MKEHHAYYDLYCGYYPVINSLCALSSHFLEAQISILPSVT